MTVAPITVALALPADRAEADLLATFAALDDVTVVRRCVEVAEALAVVQAGRADVVVVGGTLLRWDRDAVARVLACDAVVVALAPEAAAAERFRAVGIDRVAADVDAVLAAVREPRSAAGETGADIGFSRPRPTVASATASRARGSDIAAVPVEAPPANDLDAVARGQRQGAVVAVWGPIGAPGRTTTALGLATAWAHEGLDVLLIDLDTHGACLDQCVGLVDHDVPGVAAACRLAHHGRLDAESLVRVAHRVDDRLALLTGLPRADRWPELAASSLDPLWSVARSVADVVVVDVGFGLEDDEELSYDTLAPRRHAAALSALATADLVVAVGAADPIGVRRLVRGLDDVLARVERARVRVVLNRAPGRGRRLAARAEVDDVLQACGHPPAVAALPDDPAACRRSLDHARSVVAAVPRSPLARELRALAGELVRTDQPASPRGEALPAAG